MKKFWHITKLVLGGLLAVGALILIVATQKEKQSQAVKRVQFKVLNPDYKFVQEADLQPAVAFLSDTTQVHSLNKVDLQTIEEKVAKNKYVERCKVYINNSKKLQIDVLQRQPQLRVINNSGVSYYLDENGIKFPLSPTFTPNVPVVTGYVRYSQDSLGNPGAEVHHLLSLCKFIEDDKQLSSLISQIVVNRNGDFELIPRTGSHTILIGNSNLLEDKFNRLKIFYDEGLSRLGWDTYNQINLKYEGQVIAKKKGT
ncbi:MAG: hypothetical protein KTR13_08080 [Saprospiraceae bacterium]|nr:hypothetical protein [Saprospiraceae bacterium]